jgi:hypothetical protein
MGGRSSAITYILFIEKIQYACQGGNLIPIYREHSKIFLFKACRNRRVGTPGSDSPDSLEESKKNKNFGSNYFVMRRIIKSCPFILAIFFAISSQAQTNNRFFASYEDFLANKYIGGYEIEDYSWTRSFGGSESFKIKYNGSSDRKKVSELPALLTYKNTLHRSYDGDCYMVLYPGKTALYAWIGDNSGIYTSDGITGAVKRFSQKDFEKRLKDQDLLKQYKDDQPKRQMRDTPSSYYTRVIERDIKYLKILDEGLSRSKL